MGSCLSLNNKKGRNENDNSKHENVQESKTPPPLSSPSPEKETVKEVLVSSSETPTTNTLQDLNFSILNNRNKFQPLKDRQKKMLKTTAAECVSEATTSDVSSSLTESVSTLCTTTHDFKDLMHVVGKSPTKLRPRNRSFSGGFRDKSGGSLRIVRSRESGRVDPGERSGRRCKSPVMRVGGGYAPRQDLGRSFSCRRIDGSSCRVNNSGRVNKKLSESLSTKESLDNPLVSLECFIFL